MRMADAVFLTSKGTGKANNEDCFFIDPRHGIAIVADGLGGRTAGEIASRAAVDSMAGFLMHELSHGRRIDARIMRRAVLDANRAVFAEANAAPLLEGMRSTIAAVVLQNDTYYVSNAGDSRIYLVRKERIRKLSSDHTLVQEMVDHGLITEGKARAHHLRHVVTSALGCKETTPCSGSETAAAGGDRLLLCSDGLTEMLDDREIAVVVAAHRSCATICRVLIEKATGRGGCDDITVGMARIVR